MIEEQFELRNIGIEEAEEAAEIERICFPPNEACSRQMMLERIRKAPELFWWLLTEKQGKWQDF